jgi:hypothetical protein
MRNTGGYTCAFCDAFVLHGAYHSCVVPSDGDYSVTVGGADINQDTEVIKKLDKIIELLEKIRKISRR